MFDVQKLQYLCQTLHELWYPEAIASSLLEAILVVGVLCEGCFYSLNDH